MNNRIYYIYKELEDGFYMRDWVEEMEEAEALAENESIEGKAMIDIVDTRTETILRTLLYQNGRQVGKG